jgi:hypothetical protein
MHWGYEREVMRWAVGLLALGVLACASGSSHSPTELDGGTTPSGVDGGPVPDGGSTGDGGTEVDGGTGTANCPGFPITSSGALDFDVNAPVPVRLSGNLSVNGKRVTTTSLASRIELKDATGMVTRASLDPSGRYTLRVEPGTYEVALRSASSCSLAPTEPCNGGTLKAGVVVSSEGALDLDLPAVQVSGAVRVNGEVPTNASSSRGALSFQSSGGTPAIVTLPASGDALYTVTLLKGTYSVDWVPPASLCNFSGALPAMPCTGGTVVSSVLLQENGLLDVALSRVQLEGKVTVNDQPVVAVGSIRLASPKANAYVVSLSSAGAYQASLLAGTYDLSFVPNVSLCGEGGSVPCLETDLRRGLVLSSSGALDLNVPMVRLSGKVLVNGQAVFTTAPSAYVGFTDVESLRSVFVRISSTLSGSYALGLAPGVYDVSFDGNATCHAALSYPCNHETVKKAATLTQSGVLDLDVPMVRLQGRVTLNGRAWPATEPRGVLRFIGRDDQPVNFDATQQFNVPLVRGTYDLRWRPDGASCPATVSEAACLGALLAKATAVATSGALDLDLKTLQVNGVVTRAGSALPSAG